ncbi:tetraacyldisaccharide 4'-kinase [Flavicella sediminum]|uniref:tetraacyldisaccharide 4'-kinase n=1 Tax=Flavicella sediminum TaxID=2585141 RepID=UPI00112465B2|nr:tetraacyldisaccharide 4'-kinase [Flavicella sediminum]
MIKTLVEKILRILVFPISILYGIVVYFRNLFFDVGIYTSNTFKTPIIAIGNLSMGGTGKSPQIEYLIKLLQQDFKVAVLSRGYKRASKGFVLANKQSTVEELGDEPFQFYSKFKNISVAVDADRTHGIGELLKQVHKPDVILLDDAYQHRKVKAGLYILLTTYDKLYADDFLLPTGTLRESRQGAKRAKIIIVTKCPKDIDTSEKERILNKIKPTEGQRVFFTNIKYADCLISKEETIATAAISKNEVLLLTGIANPKPLLKHLDSLKVDYKHLNFPDHYNFTEKDIIEIQEKFKALTSKEKIILTTEKDYMRLQGKIPNLYYIGIETNFLEHGDVFDEMLREAIAS